MAFDMQKLVENVARQMKLKKLRVYAASLGDDTMDEFAIRLNAQPTYDETNQAKVYVEVVLDELKKIDV
jgi:hypothetical protein